MGVRVRRICEAFARDPTVSCVVFIYLDHGPEFRLRLDQGRMLTVNDFIAIVDAVPKPLLAVLDFCESTKFAEDVLDGQDDPDSPQREFGFLTSAEGCSLTSAIIISDDPTLVYQCQDPEAPLSYRIRHSMFSRAVQHSLAYKLAADATTTLSGWPALLNDPVVRMKHGFEADFRCSSGAMATKTVRSFFPWGPFSATDALNWDLQLPFGRVIADAEIGSLFDDIEADELSYTPRYVEVGRTPDKSVGEIARGTLDPNDPWQGAIQRHVFGVREKEVDPDQIPLGLIADFAVSKILALQPNFRSSHPEDRKWYDELRRHVTRINGTVQLRDAGGLCRLYYSTLPLGDKQRAIEIIETAQAEAAGIFAKMRASPSQ
jgi:hypothetical protein